MRSGRQNLATTCLLLGVSVWGCECDGIEGAAPNGFLDPTILDLGPVPLDTECTTSLRLVNNGTADLLVESAELVESNGSFSLLQVPEFVGLASSGDVLVRYTAEGEENVRQSTTVEIQTNAFNNDGLISAVVTALPTNEQAAVALSSCEAEGETQSPCESLNFGATQTSDPLVPISERAGKTSQIAVRNVGNAEMQVLAAVIDGGDGDFVVTSARLGNLVSEFPVRLAAGRDGNCGQVLEGNCATAENCNELNIDLKYAPSALGGDSATLVILTDAAEGNELRIPVSGLGSDVGLLTTPTFVTFSDVLEGQSAEKEVRLSNVGTNDAPVNNTCLDLEGDGSCDGNCTGSDPALDGALSCRVVKTDGSRDGKGFVLAPTDAQEGGSDERNIVVTWSPIAGNSNIPSGTVLRIESGILNNKVYEVPVAGGEAGILQIDSAGICGESFCVQAQGDASDIATWTGELELELINAGQATLQITSLSWEGPETIADDYEVRDESDTAIALDDPNLQLAPGATASIWVHYANDDASVQDFINLLIAHDGLGGSVTLPLRVLAPE